MILIQYSQCPVAVMSACGLVGWMSKLTLFQRSTLSGWYVLPSWVAENPCFEDHLGCHAKSVAWTNRVIFPGIYNVSNGFTVIWLFGQFRGSSCNTLALFSYLSEYHLLGALLEPSLPLRGEETFR